MSCMSTQKSIPSKRQINPYLGRLLPPEPPSPGRMQLQEPDPAQKYIYVETPVSRCPLTRNETTIHLTSSKLGGCDFEIDWLCNGHSHFASAATMRRQYCSKSCPFTTEYFAGAG